MPEGAGWLATLEPWYERLTPAAWARLDDRVSAQAQIHKNQSVSQQQRQIPMACAEEGLLELPDLRMGDWVASRAHFWKRPDLVGSSPSASFSSTERAELLDRAADADERLLLNQDVHLVSAEESLRGWDRLGLLPLSQPVLQFIRTVFLSHLRGRFVAVSLSGISIALSTCSASCRCFCCFSSSSFGSRFRSTRPPA